MAADDLEPGTRWDSFSVYGEVSKDVADAVQAAIDAYSHIDSIHAEGADVAPKRAAEARACILAAAHRLMTELENERDQVDLYDDILERWEGQDGFIQRMGQVRLNSMSPGFLHQFVRDIHRAAWELGYIRAGRAERQALEDRVEDDARSMFEEP